MTQEDKDLLLCDLCARLPYGVKVQIKNEIVVLDSICDDDGYHFNFIGEDREGVNIEQVRPYLVPLSSMTEEQGKELEEVDPEFYSLICGNGDIHVSMDVRGYDWLNKNQFDYRGLIPKGLAIDATGLDIY